MKTVTSEAFSSSIKDSESARREDESPARALALLEQASRLSERFPEDAPGAETLSVETPLSGAILSPGLISEPRGWRSYLTSAGIHVIVVALLLLIVVPVATLIQSPIERIVLIAPKLNPYRSKTINPPHIQTPRQIVKNFVAPPVLAIPVIKETAPIASVQLLPHLKIEAPAPAPAPKPQLRTGVFETADLAKKVQGAKQIKTGGFGDPHGVPANAQSSSSVTMAKLGSFDLPNGEAKGGAAGSGVVRQGSFGSADSSGSSGTGSHGSVRASGFGEGAGTGTGVGNGSGRGEAVRTSGFGDAAAVRAPGGVQRAASSQSASTPAEILFKPKPAYTEEARKLKIEGQVSLEVIFQASGGVRVLRVLHGLGHGLDEAAQQAAQQVRFRPATRGGVSVDKNATLYITFELT